MAVGDMTDGKHTAAYFKDPELLSFLTTQNLSGTFPRQTAQNKSVEFQRPYEIIQYQSMLFYCLHAF